MEKFKQPYISPQILVYEVAVESGFAQTTTQTQQSINPPSWDVEEF